MIKNYIIIFFMGVGAGYLFSYACLKRYLSIQYKMFTDEMHKQYLSLLKEKKDD